MLFNLNWTLIVVSIVILIVMMQILYLHFELRNMKKRVVDLGTGVKLPEASNYVKTYATIVNVDTTTNGDVRARIKALIADDDLQETALLNCSQGGFVQGRITYTDFIALFVQKTQSTLSLIDDVMQGQTQYVHVFDKGFRIRYNPAVARELRKTTDWVEDNHDILLLFPLQHFTTNDLSCSQPKQPESIFGPSDMTVNTILTQRLKGKGVRDVLVSMVGYRFHMQ